MSQSQSPWTLTSSPPPEWAAATAALGGGYFHSAPGLLAGAPRGEVVYGLLHGSSGVTGAALGVLASCRLSATPHHGYFPSLPLLAPGVDSTSALLGLVASLKARGVVDLLFDSFDASWCPTSIGAGVLGCERREYLVDLVESPAALKAGFSQTHRRHVQRGERSGWEFIAVAGSEAGQIMNQVQDAAAERSALRENHFEPADSADLLPSLSTGPLGPVGARVYLAKESGRVLSAVLVGWSGTRAFYVLGGSTPEGYKASASAWLHWKIMQTLWPAGVRVYNLGGAAVEGASDPAHPGHGLHRFKSGFAPREVIRRGISFEVGSLHRLGHQMMGPWLRRVGQLATLGLWAN